MRIAFLFNQRADQVWHAAPIAFELSRLDPAALIDILCADAALIDTTAAIAAGYPGHRCRIERIALPASLRLADRLLRGLFSLAKEAVLRLGVERFAGYDAVVVPDLTSLKLKRRLPGLPMIFSNHGAGDRARGYDPRIADFDFVLVAGRKLEQRFRAEGLIRDAAYAIVGYPKFDAVTAVAPSPPKLFDNDLPTVLYNPHFEPTLSSWPAWGIKLLDRFREQPGRFNLIFAPHLKLFERAVRYRARLPRRFLDCPNIHVDTGSRASADMSYTRAADIYIGDVSSQIYEFLATPRPCLFLDPRGIDWRGNPDYAHWHFGPVLRDPDEVFAALARAGEDHARFRPAQEAAISETFDNSPTPAAQRAALAVRDFVGGRVRNAGPEAARSCTPPAKPLDGMS